MRLSLARLLPFATGLLLAGCALTPAQRAQEQAATNQTQQALATRLAGLTPGAPVDCISAFPTTHTTAYGSKIVYEVSTNQLYVNDTTGGCESMARGDYLTTVSHTGRLCSGDIGQTFQPQVNIPTGSCALGKFTPYERK